MQRTATTKQVAEALGVKATTVQLYSREGRIPFDRTPGGHRRYDLDEVRDVLDRERSPARLVPMSRSTSIGAGVSVIRSRMPVMDTERRAVKGENLERAATGQGYLLDVAGAKISKLAAAFSRAAQPSEASPEARLIGAAREWLIGGTDRGVHIHVVVDAQSARAVGMYDTEAAALDEAQLSSAAAKLRRVLTATLPPDSGYVLVVEPITLDAISAAEYLALEPWLWADTADPLEQDA